MALEGVPRPSSLAGRQALILCTTLRRGMLVAIRLDDLPWDTVLAQLRLDHPQATGPMAVALLAPPASERRVVEIAELRQTVEHGVDLGEFHTGAPQPTLDLPAGSRARPQEADGDLDRRRRLARWIRCPARIASGSCLARRLRHAGRSILLRLADPLGA